ncbi:MAG: dipeptide epimerase [archaeon]|nr:dipeptide epimerase [archaeon]
MSIDDSVKVTSVELFKYNLLIKHPISISIYEAPPTSVGVFVKINTNNGLYGLGEASPYPPILGDNLNSAFEIGKFLAKNIKGKNPLAVEARMREIDMLMPANTNIKCAFDQAMYDLLGKQAKLPLYALLGGEKRKFYTDCTIGIQDTLELTVERAKAIVKEGFPAIKMKIGRGKDLDVAQIKAVREQVSQDITIRTDANQGWDLPTAVATLKALEPYNIEYAEQPLPYWDYENMRRLRNYTLTPICADESVFDHHDAFKLASMGACDYLNIKLTKSSGIHNALKINSIAEAAGLKCMIGCFSETRLGLSSAAHLVSAFPNIHHIDLDSALFLAEDPITGGMQYDEKDGGLIILPDTPGHGAEIKEDYLENKEKITERVEI